MRLPSVIAATAVAVVLASGLAELSSQSDRVYVSVTDSKGVAKEGITSLDLAAEIDGRPVDIAGVEPAALPVSVVVTIEGIGSERVSDTRATMRAVIAGARAIHPQSRVGLMVDDGATPPKMLDVNADADALEREVNRFFGSPNAPLLDSIVIAAQTLATERHVRRSILAVTWGNRVESDVMSAQRVAQELLNGEVSLWVLDLGGRRHVMGSAEQRVIADVTTMSGGRGEPTSMAAMASKAEGVMALIRGQYVVRFTDGRPTTPHVLKVTARSRGLKVLAPSWPVK